MTAERTPNRTASETCQVCADTGTVLVQTRKPGKSLVKVKGKFVAREPVPDEVYEEMGPCPECEAGLWLEFGIGRRVNAKGKLEEYRNPRPPWGQRGYWRGRAPVYQEARPLHEEPLSVEENALRMRLLTRRYEAIRAGQTENLPDPCAGLKDGLSPKARIKLLTELAMVKDMP